MKFATGAGILATVGLLAVGQVPPAHATTSITPNVECDYELTDAGVKLTVTPPELLGDVRVSIDGELVEQLVIEDANTVVIGQTEAPSAVKVSLGESDDGTECDESTPEPSTTPTAEQPPPEESPGPSPSSTATPEPPPTESSTEPEPTPTTTEPSTPNPSPSTQPPASSTPPPTPSPSRTTPAQPSTSPAPTQPQSPALPTTPDTTVPEAIPDVAAGTGQGPSDEAPETSQETTRQFRPLAESPRYLLPHLLGTRSAQRGSPLILPQPQNSQDRAGELETLPPISEDELDAIKAQLSSPGRADTAISAPHVPRAEPDERVSANFSWWFVVGLTVLLGVGGYGWLSWHRRRRRH